MNNIAWDRRITGTTGVVGVLGYPVAHSLSPVMHNAAFAALGLDWVYVPFPVSPDTVAAAVAGIPALGIRGVNVTIPHKHAIIAYLDQLTPEAEAVRSVNTIVVTTDGLLGHSTDGPGFLRGLTERGFCVRGKRTVVLGSGGAARAVVGALAGAGAASVAIVARSPARAQELAQLAAHVAPASLEVTVLPWDDRVADWVAQADLLVNATPIGMSRAGNAEVPPAWLHPELWVYDLVYTPRETALLQAAAARGCPTIDGIAMLVYQGADAFTLWTGQEAPVDVMRAALLAAIG